MEKNKNSLKKIVSISAIVSIFFLTSCQSGFEPIDYGTDACAHCKMTIVDPRFAAELITDKGRVYKFDDIICMKQYATRLTNNKTDFQYFVAEYMAPKEAFIDATNAIYLQSSVFKSPMNGNAAAFRDVEQATMMKDSLMIQPTAWSNLKQ